MLNFNYDFIISFCGIITEISLENFIFYSTIIATPVILVSYVKRPRNITLQDLANIAAITGTAMYAHDKFSKKDSNKDNSNNGNNSSEGNSSGSGSSGSSGNNNNNSGNKSTNSPLSTALLFTFVKGLEPGDDPMNYFAYFTLLAGIFILTSSTNIIIHYTALFLISKGDYEKKYPKLAWLIRRYQKSTISTLVLSIIMFYIVVFILIITSFKVSMIVISNG